MVDLKVRFYEISVKATDSGGNTGRDVCKVVIVPECSPRESNCEELMMGVVRRRGSKRSKSSKSSKSAKKQKFPTQENLNRAVTESMILYDLAYVQLVWNTGLDSPTV